MPILLTIAILGLLLLVGTLNTCYGAWVITRIGAWLFHKEIPLSVAAGAILIALLFSSFMKGMKTEDKSKDLGELASNLFLHQLAQAIFYSLVLASAHLLRVLIG